MSEQAHPVSSGSISDGAAVTGQAFQNPTIGDNLVETSIFTKPTSPYNPASPTRRLKRSAKKSNLAAASSRSASVGSEDMQLHRVSSYALLCLGQEPDNGSGRVAISEKDGMSLEDRASLPPCSQILHPSYRAAQALSISTASNPSCASAHARDQDTLNSDHVASDDSGTFAADGLARTLALIYDPGPVPDEVSNALPDAAILETYTEFNSSPSNLILDKKQRKYLTFYIDHLHQRVSAAEATTKATETSTHASSHHIDTNALKECEETHTAASATPPSKSQPYDKADIPKKRY